MKSPSPTLSQLLALLLCAAPIAATSGQVYKVVDEAGRVTYTDKPPPTQQGERLDLPALNTQPGIELPPPPQPREQAASTDYDRVEIVQPINGVTIPPGQLNVVIQITLSPQLQPNHLISVLMDGSPVAKPAATTSVMLDNLERGAHQIEAQIIDENGRLVAASKPVTFYVKRASKLIKPKR